MSRRRSPAACAAALALLLSLLAPLPARGDHLANSPNWPELLPADLRTGPGTISPGFAVCPGGRLACPRRVIEEMYERWRPLNARCDHDAVFALTYLRTTEEFLRTIIHQPSFFDGRRWINREDTVFGELYFRAFDAWKAGEEVPEAWRIAFEAGRSDDVTAIGDMLLGMNAHIQRDLPYTLAAVGLRDPRGGSRKIDHDRVNFFLERVADPLQEELGRRYDELFTTTDASPSPLDETLVLQAVRAMRENAWRNAERLVSASSASERRQVADSIESQAATAARTIRAQSTVPGYGPTRDAWCRDRLTRSFRVRVADVPLRRILRTRRLPVRVFADGPADVRLIARRDARRQRGAQAVAAASRPRPVALSRPLRLRLAEPSRRQARLRITKEGVRRLRRDRPHVRVRAILGAPRGMVARHARRLR